MEGFLWRRFDWLGCRFDDIGFRPEHDVQYGGFDPPIKPGKRKAGEPEPIAAEGQAQQQRVNQQGEQVGDNQPFVDGTFFPDWWVRLCFLIWRGQARSLAGTNA